VGKYGSGSIINPAPATGGREIVNRRPGRP